MTAAIYKDRKTSGNFCRLALAMVFCACSAMGFAQAGKSCNSPLPSVVFASNKATLTETAKKLLATVASELKNNPNCTITVINYPQTSKSSQGLCQKRLEIVKIYLIEREGISADRINTDCEAGGGNPNVSDIRWN